MTVLTLIIYSKKYLKGYFKNNSVILFSLSELSMKSKMLINVRIPIIVVTLIFISMLIELQHLIGSAVAQW